MLEKENEENEEEEEIEEEAGGLGDNQGMDRPVSSWNQLWESLLEANDLTDNSRHKSVLIAFINE